MKSNKGYIKIFRSMEDWEWWSEPVMVKAWLFLLIRAAHEPTKYKKIVIERGQYWTSERRLAKDLDVSKSKARNILMKLKLTNDITTHTDHQNTIITICNYDYWQGQIDDDKPQRRPRNNRKGDQKVTERQTTNTNSEQPKRQPLNNHTIDCDVECCEVFNDEVQPPIRPKINEKIGVRTDLIQEEKKERRKEYIISSSSSSNRVVEIENLVEWLEHDSGEIWRDQIAMQLGVKDKAELTELFEFYQRELICHGVEFKVESDIKKHFTNMIRVELSKRRQNGNNRTNGNKLSAEDEKRRRDEEFAQHIAQQLANPTS